MTWSDPTTTRAEYGSQLIRHLARALGEEFGKGMSVANLRNFRQFYLTFPDAGKHYALRSKLSWTHWRLIMRVENQQARGYYIEETSRQQWTSRVLERAIGNSVTVTSLRSGAEMGELSLNSRLTAFGSGSKR